MANWNHETFVQWSLDNNFNRPLYFLLDYLLEQNDDPALKHIMIQDFPQLISQEQVVIYSFLNEFMPKDSEHGTDD